MNETLLKKRIGETSRMEPIDAVKLVYQSELGCGHLLNTQKECVEYVACELAITPENPDMQPATSIGGGLCRLNLAMPDVHKLSPERIVRMMQLTAEQVPYELSSNALTRLEQSFAMLVRLADANETPFSASDLHAYLSTYRTSGYPLVSHSPSYREAYVPAYRVILSDFVLLLPVIAAIDEQLLHNARATVMLDGDCGAGKTTLGNLLAALYNTNALHMDDFFLPFDMRTETRMNTIGGNLHYERFESEILKALVTGSRNKGDDIEYQRYDCPTGSFFPKTHKPSTVTVIEGSYSHHPRLAEMSTQLQALRIFVWADSAEQLRRLTQRDPSKLSRFENEWIPLEKTYFQAYDIRGRANIALKSQPWEDTE